MQENYKENIYTSTKGPLNQVTSKDSRDILSEGEIYNEKEKEKVNIIPYEDTNDEFINQEIPVNINDISEIRSKTNLSLEQERIIQKLPTFRLGNEKIHDEVINSDKYLDLKEYKPLYIRNPPVFFLDYRFNFYFL